MKFSSTFKFWYQRTVCPTCFSQLRSPLFGLFTTVCGVSVCRWRGASKARLVLSCPCTLVFKNLYTCALSQAGVLWWKPSLQYHTEFSMACTGVSGDLYGMYRVTTVCSGSIGTELSMVDCTIGPSCVYPL